ncbi:MAG TPA: ATP-binding protein [Thermoanaerobaculia bacterium]|nr:ATP-binding protein [Thermoanaerobaculia bacterium]
MTPIARSPRRSTDLLWIAISLLALLPTVYYSYVAFIPGLGFEMWPKSWQVLGAPQCGALPDCVRPGDRILSLAGVEHDRFFADRSLPLFQGFREDGTGSATVLRAGRRVEVPVRLRTGLSALSALGPLQGLFPLVFWFFGTAIVLFLRPRDERWLVLVLFSYTTAVLLASGLASSRHTAGAAIVFHAVIWLFVPLAVHLHALLPSPLFGRHRPYVLAALYLVSLVLAALDASYRLKALPALPVIAFIVGIVSALGLLLGRLFLPAPPSVRLATRIMLYGVALGFAPIAVIFAVLPAVVPRLGAAAPDTRPLFPVALVIGLVAIPIPPASYAYAIYKHTLGALEFRANRLIGAYGFWALYLTLSISLLLAVGAEGLARQSRTLAALLATALVLVFLAPPLRDRFQTLVDRHVFGIRHTPGEVVRLIAEKIPRAFDREVLSRALEREILPTLLVRQSALHLATGATVETLYTQGLPAATREPSRAELEELLAYGRRYLAPGTLPLGSLEWVRLAIPLEIKEEALGVWLLGRRDPDDFYPADDVQLLSTVANQVAPMLDNIRLYERAQLEIEQRRAAELEIRRSEERFRTLFEATLEGIAIVRDGKVIAVNDALTAILDAPAGDLEGRDLAALLDLGTEPLSSVPRETVGRRRGGASVQLEIAGKEHVFEGEDVTVVAIRDIDRRKRDEEERDRLQRQLLLAQKMEAIGRLSAGVAHDFNNCLLAIFGYGDLLLETYRDDEFLRQNLTGLREAGDKAAALTQQLLAFARRQSVEARRVDLNESISGLHRMLHRLLGDDVAITTALHPDLPSVHVDPHRLEQVLVNLAVNARHAMPEGGKLAIRTEPVTVAVEAPAEHDVPPGVWAAISVEDTGLGMDSATQARIFEPFFSTREVGEGTGLGLSTAYGFVQQSGGRIFVDSAPGRGARFTIYLPADFASTVVPRTAAVDEPEAGDETVLLVEDEEKVREVVRRILAARGYLVLEAGSGAAALELAASFAGPIDLLLTDLTMPGLKGTELAAQLLEVRPDLRVLYMSGFRDEAQPAGTPTPPWLQKPFSSQVLARTVRAALGASGSTGPSVPGGEATEASG